jgi:hypothetical protein
MAMKFVFTKRSGMNSRFSGLLTSFLLLLNLNPIAYSKNISETETTWKTQKNCDIPGESLQSFSKISNEDCELKCKSHTNCQAYVYVSGWQKCFLKRQSKPRADLTFLSADVFKGGRGVGEPQIKIDFDHNGKDLKRLELDQVEDCVKACQQENACQAITYLKGYRVCWLKHSGGQLRPKVFSCGWK